jgi:hypothetical protein
VVVDHQAELLGFHNSSHPQHSNDTINGGEMNGSVFSGGAADNFLSTAQHDFAPFGIYVFF